MTKTERIVIAREDFERLVAGEVVAFTHVNGSAIEVALSDIGFRAMELAILKAAGKRENWSG